MAIKSGIRGVDLVAKNIIKYTDGFLKTVNKTMGEVDFILDGAVTKNISASDHTLADLRRLDHPYATRHGSRGLNLHDPNYVVHKQSGKLLKSKFHGVNKADIKSGVLKASAFAGLDQNKAPHALHVELGTSKMIPRPVLQGSREEVLPQAFNLIKKNLKNLTFGFKG